MDARPVPPGRLEPVDAWGGAVRSEGFVHRPGSAEEAAAVLRRVREAGGGVVLRGAGCSYGDASLHPGGAVLDLTGLGRILEWDPGSGLAVCEPGVTFGRLWRHALGDGFWPPVVPGTAAVTVGGALAANIHGKNAFRAGPLGEHVAWFELLGPDGAVRRCSPDAEGEVFRAAAGGFGLLGCFTRIALRLRPVASGLLEVRSRAFGDLASLLAAMRERSREADHLVGWVDAFARGASLGRGLLHEARHLGAGEDPDRARSLRADSHGPPARVLGILPRGVLWRGLRCFAWEGGMRLLHGARWAAGARRRAPRREGLADFHFLLDAVPGWKRAYGPGGLVQFQSFVPAAAAESVFAGQIRRSREEGLVPWLSVVKLHRRDGFLLSHGVDGFSLAMDFPVLRGREDRLRAHLRSLAAEAVAAGGRFYLAKDAVLTPGLFADSLPPGTLAEFRRLKARLDPEGVLRSAMAERLGLLAAPA